VCVVPYPEEEPTVAQDKPRKFKMPPGDPDDPQGMIRLMEEYFIWMAVKNYSPRTIDGRRLMIGYFVKWAYERGLTQPSEITKPILERYQRYLYHYRKSNGEPLSTRSHHGRMIPVRGWFKWLARQNHLLYNPASDLELPRTEHRLPKHVLTASEAEHVINVANVGDPLGIRDRAILETLYSTGIRRMEICGVKLYDLDYDRGTVIVRQGKGRKDRMIPIGSRAVAWIERYTREVRPTLLVGDLGGDYLFLTAKGDEFKFDEMTALVKRYVDQADLGKNGDVDAGERGRHPVHPADARPRQAGDDADLHPGVDQEAEGDPHRHPPGPARTLGRGEVGGAGQAGGVTVSSWSASGAEEVVPPPRGSP
jgi:integrase/recombinase XerD